MPRRAKAKGLHHRGRYWLDWDRASDGTMRSPNLTIFWYDGQSGRIRSASTGTADEATALRKLILRDLSDHGGGEICPTCGQRKPREEGAYFVTHALAEYRAVKADDGSMCPRIDHVVDYIATLPSAEIRCGDIDAQWIERFRIWSRAQPVIFSSGRVRSEPRAASTTENSVIALQSAINQAFGGGKIKDEAKFRPIATKEINNTPTRRLTIAEIAAAFRYATDPNYPAKRLALHRFLQISVGTAARPDAAYDFSVDPVRRQWNPERRVIALNPKGRRQTKKRRAVVIAPWQLALRIGELKKGYFVPVKSVRSAWDTMCEKLGWVEQDQYGPVFNGETGTKLIRRSVAQLLRDMGTDRAELKSWRDPTRKVPSEEIELVLGHRSLDSVSDLYAAFDPSYVANATRAIETIIDAIESLAPGAYHRRDTGKEPVIVPIIASKKAR